MLTSAFKQKIIDGLGFTEGPLWTRQQTLMTVGLSRGVVYELDSEPWIARPPVTTGGRPNGLAEGANGDIWVTQAGHDQVPPCIQLIRHGVVTNYSADFNAPNDLAFGADGLLWFTDPQGHAIGSEAEPGRIWTMDTHSGMFSLKTEGAHYPNGLAFCPGNEFLYVAETGTASLLRYRLTDNNLGAPELFATLPDGHPDGIAFDCEGFLYVAATTAGNVQVFAPDGSLVEIISLPADGFATNVCFGGPGMKILFVTSPKGGSIYAVERNVPGLPLLYPA